MVGLGTAALAQADTVSNGPPAAATTTARTITVMGTGYSTLPQANSSKATININLNSQGSSIPEVVGDLQKVDTAIRQALTQIGISASDVQGQNLNVSGGNNGPFKGPYPGPGPGPSQGPSFTAGESLNVNLTSNEESSVISAVYAAESQSGETVNFNVWSNNNTQPPEEQVAGDALSGALSMASARAQIIASHMGVTLGPIQDVQQIQSNGPFYGPNGPDSMPLTLQVTFATEG